LSPESAVAYYYLGRAEQSVGSFDRAATDYQKAMSLRDGFSEAGMALGLLYEQKQMNEKALAVYKGLYDDTQDAAAADRIATIYLKKERYNEAVPYLEAIRNADPDDMNVRVKLGLVQMELK